MPERKTLKRAAEDKREGKHGARSTKQAIAIGLSKARRAGVDLPPPKKGTTPEKTRKSAARAYKAGHGAGKKPVSARRSRAVESALKREPHAAATKSALSKQAKSAARKRSPSDRSAAARKAADTKGAAGRSAAARKAAATRARRGH